MTKLQTALLRCFSTNFMVYYQSHVAHVNLRGDDFLQYHTFLGEIYEDAQENIDKLGEFLRISECDMPESLGSLMVTSEVSDSFPLTPTKWGDYNRIFTVTYENIETLIDLYISLYKIAEDANDFGLSGYVQERLITHKKQCWKLKMLLEEEYNDD